MTAIQLYRLIIKLDDDAQIFVQNIRTGEKDTVIQLVLIPLDEPKDLDRSEIVLQY